MKDPVSKNAHQQRKKTIIFLHIPRAGGTTLSSIIERNYPKDCIYTIDGSRVLESIQEFKGLPESERSRIRCVKGHMPFGLHMYLSQPSTYVTMLRDPVERIVSHYYYVLRTPSHYLHNLDVDNRMNLAEYVSSGISAELTNGQTRDISGMGCFEMTDLSDDVLEIAKKNLIEYFALVGVNERFDEFLILMKRIFGWENIFYVRENVGICKGNISSDIIQIIERHNRLDRALYEFAKQLFEKRIQEIGPPLGKELRLFRFLNPFLGRYSKWMFRARKIPSLVWRR